MRARRRRRRCAHGHRRTPHPPRPAPPLFRGGGEGPLLLAEIERTLRAAVDTAFAAHGEPSGTPVPLNAADPRARVAAEYAITVTRHMNGQATGTAVRAHRFARAATAS